MFLTLWLCSWSTMASWVQPENSVMFALFQLCFCFSQSFIKWFISLQHICSVLQVPCLQVLNLTYEQYHYWMKSFLDSNRITMLFPSCSQRAQHAALHCLVEGALALRNLACSLLLSQVMPTTTENIWQCEESNLVPLLSIPVLIH